MATDHEFSRAVPFGIPILLPVERSIWLLTQRNVRFYVRMDEKMFLALVESHKLVLEEINVRVRNVVKGR